ncbi:MAG: aldo/keto reductase [Candidatus Rokubacteria bacterium]|nr:aldo/keto reductase [Candidatus Rokubacteria bacterium]
MEYRILGKTGLRVSALGFGCGNVGGLMVRGAPAERERAVARAIELGINYFDTAPLYGDGLSEQHLGQALKALKASVYVGTKFRLDAGDMRDVPGAIARSAEASLRRLGMERVDLLQLHNPIGGQRREGSPGVPDVLQEVVPALQRLQQQGKTRFFGITALGETPALHRVIDAGVIDTAQVCYNLLNPSAGAEVPAGFPAQDFGR